ncbi:hypothetical protein FG078_12980 [Vibrio cholerae]|nr:hypothetical protein [Vibrio cholerae]EGR0479215.1 hypothetical protein [Vibrio cholerae]EGR0508191.1 hypothetical protein [Vibrio cholerae]RBO16692.1 hypothetical protein DSL61_09040 [Vibrio cholerae]TLE24669.1 hypothetical protein D2926_12200 [Vibrio cholerae]
MLRNSEFTKNWSQNPEQNSSLTPAIYQR